LGQWVIGLFCENFKSGPHFWASFSAVKVMH
jgi:hypothetical protein